jgi:hypothetical protein
VVLYAPHHWVLFSRRSKSLIIPEIHEFVPREGDRLAPRLQDLSREQAYGHEARMILRSAPLLMLRSTCAPASGRGYFEELFDFVHLLCDVALGNVSVGDAKERSCTFNAALYAPDIFEVKSQGLVCAVLLATDALGDLGTVRYHYKPGGSRHDDHRHPPAAARAPRVATRLPCRREG